MGLLFIITIMATLLAEHAYEQAQGTPYAMRVDALVAKYLVAYGVLIIVVVICGHLVTNVFVARKCYDPATYMLLYFFVMVGFSLHVRGILED